VEALSTMAHIGSQNLVARGMRIVSNRNVAASYTSVVEKSL
jgi:hypothetical protein